MGLKISIIKMTKKKHLVLQRTLEEKFFNLIKKDVF